MKNLITLFVWLLLLPSLAWGLEFQPLGYESLSMGGAGVASARGSFATYYNPALLAEHRHGAQISVTAGLGIREVNLADHIDKLADVGVISTIDDTIDYINDVYQSLLNGTSGTLPKGLTPDLQHRYQTILSELRAIGVHNRLQLMPSAAVGVQVKNFGFGVFGLSEGTAQAVVDTQHLDIIVKVPVNSTDYYLLYDPNTNALSYTTDPTPYKQSSLEYALENGLTYLKLTGLAYVEIPVAYAHRFQTPWGTLDLGASVKLMPGWTYDGRIDVDTASGDINSKLKDYDKTDTSWGIDLGLLYKPAFLKGLSLGLVGKNLNTPKFDTVTGDTYEIDPQVRLGLAYDFAMFTLAFDADLTKNETFIPDYDAQYIGGGINFHPFSWFCVRAGAMKNLAESDEGVVLTGGLGFGLKWFQLDLAAQVSTKSGEYDGNDIPRYARVQVSLVSKWF